MKFYHVQFFSVGDPTAHSRIVATKDIKAWQEFAEGHGAFVTFVKELTEQEAMNGQKYYPVLLAL